MNNYKEVLKKVILLEKIDLKVKNKTINSWLKEFLLVKNLIIRLVSFVTSTIIFSIIFFVLRKNGLNDLYGDPSFNAGIAFGNMQNSGWVVYLVKISMTIILFFLSFTTNTWYLEIPLWIIANNSLFNVIDKLMPDFYNGVWYYDTVVDYFQWPTFKNNIADIFIIGFLIFLAVEIIAIIIYNVFKYKKQKESEQPKGEQKDIPCQEQL